MTDRTPTAPDPKALRSLMRSAPRTPGRTEAFLELVAQEPSGLNRTLRSMALDPDLDRAMRLNAVSALGREATSSSLNALRASLDVDDEVVRRRAVMRLGKVGAVDDLATLKAVRTGNPTTQRTLRAAKCFVSYRHGLGEYRHDEPRRVFGASSEDAVPLRTGALTKTLRTKLEQRGVNLPGLEVALDPAWRVECPGNTYVLVLNAEFVGEGMLSLADRQAMPGVLVKENIETGTFDPAFYLTTDPAGHGRFHVFGVRSSGAVAVYGEGTVDEGVVGVDLESTERPLVHPVTVQATYVAESGRLRFETALVEPRFADGQQARRRQPREG